jgi:glutamate decarboxylase
MLLKRDDPERYIAGLPVVSFHLTDEFRKEYPQVKQASVSTLLRVKGWILPNYPLPPNEEKTEILRAVIRESFSASTFPFCMADYEIWLIN